MQPFLLAFRKFAGHRSLPKIMISDNGSTYVYMSADEELHKLMELTEVKEELGRRGVSSPRELRGMRAFGRDS